MKKVLLIALTVHSAAMFGVYPWKDFLFGARDLEGLGRQARSESKDKNEKVKIDLAMQDLKNITRERIINFKPVINEEQLEFHTGWANAYKGRINHSSMDDFMYAYHDEMAKRYFDVVKAQSIDRTDDETDID